MGSAISFIIGLLVIAIIITIHETGHFLASRLVKVKVETFAIGWGRALKRWHSKGIEYRINIFPLGGYCRLDSESLLAVHPLKRIFVYLAGSLFNLIFAILIFSLFFSLSYQAAVLPNKIVVSNDYPTLFEELNLSTTPFISGDEIIAINNNVVEDFSDIQRLLASEKKGSTTSFDILRDNKVISASTKGIWDNEQKKNLYGISYFMKPIINQVKESSPEAIAGLSNGDTIISFNNHKIENSLDLISLLAENPSLIELEVITKDNQQKTIKFYPTITNEGNAVLSFSFYQEIKSYKGDNLFKSISNGFKEAFSTFVQTFKLIPNLFKGKNRLDNTVAGPLRISYIIGSMRNVGLRALLHVVASVSASLAAANFIPLPGLDGGAIVIGIIEIIRKKPLSETLYFRFQSVGLVLLLILMILVISSDLQFFFSY